MTGERRPAAGSAMERDPRRGVEVPRSARVLGGGLGALVVGALVLAFGFAVDPDRAFLAYLGAFVFALTVVLGTLCLVMIAHASGARWFVVVRRLAESVAATLPLFFVLFVPLLFGLHRLYPWVPPLPVELPQAAVEKIHAKQAWLNVPFFVVRSAIYLAVWSALALLLRGWSLRQDADPERAPRRFPVVVSGPGLILFGFSVTFAAFDWVMSLSPEWLSTVFGVYVFAGGIVGGLGLMLVLVRRFELAGLLAGAVRASHVHALGRLLLTFVVFWAYIAFSQGFLIWIADLPHEVSWYLARWDSGWFVVLWALILGHFLLPFLVLLSRPLKRSSRAMAAVGGWMLAIHWVDVCWMVLPALRTPGGAAHGVETLWLGSLWMDLAALLAVCGALTAFAGWLLAGHPALPRRDPQLETALGYDSP